MKEKMKKKKLQGNLRRKSEKLSRQETKPVDPHKISEAAMESFENTTCSSTKEEIVTSSEPVFFMNGSICNIPSPISVPTKVYDDGIELALKMCKEIGCDKVSKYTYAIEVENFMYHELICSISNLIISSFNECMIHIINSDVFTEPPTIVLSIRDQLLDYRHVYGLVKSSISPYCTSSLTIGGMEPEQVPIFLQTSFIAPVTAKATEVFANIANEFANSLATLCYDFTYLNPHSVILYRMQQVNPSILEAENNRNIIFGVVSAMLYNYAFAFSGMVEVEIHRITVSKIEKRAYINGNESFTM